MVTPARLLLAVAATASVVGNVAGDVKAWGEPGYWVKLRDISPGFGRLYPAFDPSGTDFTLFIDDPSATAVSLTLALDLTKYDPQYLPKISVNGEVLHYSPVDSIRAVVHLGGMRQRLARVRVEDPKAGSGGFMFFSTPARAHEYAIHIVRPPNPRSVVTARSLVVRNTAEQELVGEPAFDPDALNQTIKYVVDEREYGVHIFLECPSGGGRTVQVQEGMPSESVGAPAHIVLSERYVESVRMECRYTDDTWPQGAEPLRARYRLLFERSLRTDSMFRAMLMVPAELGYCEKVDTKSKYLEGWKGDSGAQYGFVCRVESLEAEAIPSLASPHMQAQLIHQPSGLVTELSSSEARRLWMKANKEYFTLRAFDRVAEVQYPTVFLHVARCTSMSIPDGFALREMGDEVAYARMCMEEKCADSDKEHCFARRAGCSSYSGVCGAFGHLRADAATALCARSACSAARDQGRCCSYEALEVGTEVELGGRRFVVLKREEDGGYAIIEESTGKLYEGVAPASLNRTATPTTFARDEEVLADGRRAVVLPGSQGHVYRVQPLVPEDAPIKTVDAGALRKSPAFLFRTLGRASFAEGERVTVGDTPGVVFGDCGGETLCEVRLDGKTEARSLHADDIDVAPGTPVLLNGYQAVVARADPGGAKEDHRTYTVVFADSGGSLSGLRSSELRRLPRPAYHVGEEVRYRWRSEAKVTAVEGEGAYTVRLPSGVDVHHCRVFELQKVPEYYAKRASLDGDAAAAWEEHGRASVRYDVRYDDGATEQKVPANEVAGEQVSLRAFATATEVVLRDGRHGHVAADCGGDDLCEVILESAGASSGPVPADELRRAVRFSPNDAVTVDGRSGVIAGSCDEGPRPSCEVAFDGAPPGHNVTISASKIQAHSFLVGQGVAVNGRPGVIASTCIRGARCEVSFHDDRGRAVKVNSSLIERRPLYDSGDIVHVRSRTGVVTGRWVHTPVRGKLVIPPESSTTHLPTIIAGGGGGAVIAGGGGGAVIAGGGGGAVAPPSAGPPDGPPVAVGTRVLVRMRPALVLYYRDGRYSVMFQERGESMSNIRRAELDVAGAEFLDGDIVQALGRRAEIIQTTAEVDGSKSFRVRFTDGTVSKWLPQTSLLQPLTRPDFAATKTFAPGDRVTVGGKPGRVVIAHRRMNAFVVAFDDGHMTGPLKPFQLAPPSAPGAGASSDFAANSEVEVYGKIAVVRGGPTTRGWYNVSFYEDGLTTYLIPSWLLRPVSAEKGGRIARDGESSRALVSGGGGKIVLHVGDHVSVGAASGFVVGGPFTGRRYAVRFTNGSSLIVPGANVALEASLAGSSELRIGQKVEVRGVGKRAVVVLGPDAEGGYMVRFAEDGHYGGPYTKASLLPPKGDAKGPALLGAWGPGARTSGPRRALLPAALAAAAAAAAMLAWRAAPRWAGARRRGGLAARGGALYEGLAGCGGEDDGVVELRTLRLCEPGEVCVERI